MNNQWEMVLMGRLTLRMLHCSNPLRDCASPKICGLMKEIILKTEEERFENEESENQKGSG